MTKHINTVDEQKQPGPKGPPPAPHDGAPGPTAESPHAEDNSFVDLDQDEISRMVSDMQYDSSGGDSSETEAVTDAESTSENDSPADSPATGSNTLNQQEIADIVAKMKAEQTDQPGDITPGNPKVVLDPDSLNSGASEKPPATDADMPDLQDESSDDVAGISTDSDTSDAANPSETYHGSAPDDRDPERDTDEDAESENEAAAKTDALDDDGISLREIHTSFIKKPVMVWVLIGLAIIGAAAVLGYHVLSPSPVPLNAKTKQPSLSSSQQKRTVADGASVKPIPHLVESQPQKTPDPNLLKLEAILKSVEGLREQLLIKQGEIIELKKYYQDGIETVETEILAEKNRLGVQSFQKAIEHQSINMRLQTIQRRRTYIQSLDRPYRWLEYGGEELLYFKRKTALERMVLPVADHIELNAMIQEAEALIQKYTIGPGTLTPNIQQNMAPGIEKLWHQVVQKEKRVALGKLVTKSNEAHRQHGAANQPHANEAIWEEICNGDFKRKAELTALSPEAAKCLSYCNDSDLFLNRISGLSPKAAKHLFTWQGHWLCLNGFKTLSAEVALYLFRWQGSWISLNGLDRLNPDASDFLRHWPGKRLEMMGLDHHYMKAHEAVLKNLARWEKQGGELYVGQRIRQLIQQVE